MGRKITGRLLTVVLAASLLAGCVSLQPVGSAATPAAPGGETMPAMATESGAVPNTGDSAQPQGTLVVQQSPEPDLVPDVTFKLVTGVENGQMVFFGSGGTLDGAVNPTLRVNPGDVVELVLVNGDGILHDLAVEGYGIKTPGLSDIAAEARLVFRADMEGRFPYFCDVPGHRQAGMEGTLIVGQVTGEPETELPSVSMSPDQVPAPIDRSEPQTIRLDLETTEVQARLADGSTYTFWTFNGTVPGPFVRVRVGDTVEVSLANPEDSLFPHSVDFHAATGPGGGAEFSQTDPGEQTTFTFKALNPGLYVYHCATPSVAHHITNGMYGLILVEPEGGLPPVDREFYVMQGEIYTAEAFGQRGHLGFSAEKLKNESPEYFIFNGSVGALTDEYPLRANVGERVRIYFGVGGPNFISSFHVIGEIFDQVYNLGSLTAPPLTDVQSVVVPTGGSTMVEFTVDVPGRYVLVDHSLSRAERGLVGHLIVEGQPNPEIIDGTPSSEDAY